MIFWIARAVIQKCAAGTEKKNFSAVFVNAKYSGSWTNTIVNIIFIP